MIVGLVGAPAKINNMEMALRQMDRGLEISRLELESLPKEEHLPLFRQLQKTADIIIIAGYYDYMYFTGHVSPKKITGYVARDILTLYHTLLQALSGGYDINRISVDGYGEEELREIFEETGRCGNLDSVYLYKDAYRDSTLFDETVEGMVSFHSETYRSRNTSVCLTCISPVHERLQKMGIPSILVGSTYENVRLAYEKLRLEYFLKEKETGQTLIIYMEMGKGTRQDRSGCYLELDKLKAAEKILSFALELQAAVEEIAWGKYILVVDRNVFERLPYRTRLGNLLREVRKAAGCRLSIGAGTSDLMWEAGENARAALDKALTQEVSCAYVVYNNVLVDGPILSSEEKESVPADRRWQKIAEETSLSINTVLKFHAIVEKYRSNVFTVNELSLVYGCSLRSMYRMVEKLEQCGYIEEDGKRMINDAGRPSRILKIKF